MYIYSMVSNIFIHLFIKSVIYLFVYKFIYLFSHLFIYAGRVFGKNKCVFEDG